VESEAENSPGDEFVNSPNFSLWYDKVIDVWESPGLSRNQIAFDTFCDNFLRDIFWLFGSIRSLTSLLHFLSFVRQIS
jgi:hypothetical protein